MTRILDVACGTGLMTAEFVSRGHSVVGVDASMAMLARAHTLLGPDVPLLHTVLPELPDGLDGPFDAAVSTLDALNYLTLTDLRRTLVALAGVLRPGGWLAFDVHAEAALAFLIANPVITGEDAGASFTLTTSVNPTTRACATTIALDGPSGGFVEKHVQYVHSEEQIRAALADAGFVVLAVTDEYSDQPTGPDTLRAGWLARKSAG